MIEATVPASSLKISDLKSGLKITATGLSPDNQLYVALSDGRLLLYQLPAKTEIAKGEGGGLPTHSGEYSTFDATKIEAEEATLVNTYQLEAPATQIAFLEYLNYIVLLINKAVEIYSVSVQHDIRLVDRFEEFKFNLIKTWSDVNPPKNDDGLQMGDMNEEDSEYDNSLDDDSISLARVRYPTAPSPGHYPGGMQGSAIGPGGGDPFTVHKSNCQFLCMSSKRYIVILRWRYREYDTKFEYKLQDRPSLLEFLNSDTLLVSFEGGDLVKMNVSNGMTTPLEIQFLDAAKNPQGLTFPAPSRSSFFFGSTETLVEAFKTTNDRQLVILRDNMLIKLNSDLEPISHHTCHRTDFKNPMTVPATSAVTNGNSSQRKLIGLSYWFPYIFALYGNAIEVRNLENYSIVQRLIVSDPKKLGSSIKIQANSKNLLLVTEGGIYKFIKTDFNYQLKQFEQIGDYNNAIDLLEKLNPAILDDSEELAAGSPETGHSHPPRQLKFMKLRQLQMENARAQLRNGSFDQAMHLFIEFLAPPQTVLSNLPESLTTVLSDTNIDDFTREIPHSGSLPADNGGSSTFSRSAPASPRKAQSQGESQSSTPPSPKKKAQRAKPINRTDEHEINELITYLTDTRRKLTRLLDPSHPEFEWHGYMISLSLYEEMQSDPNFTPRDSLKLIDDNLFKCYILTNPRMIGPFLRIPNYCDFDLIEKECMNMKMYSELIDFYYIRRAHEKALHLLDSLCFEDSVPSGEGSLSQLFNAEYMVRYLQKLGNDNINLILKYSTKLIELDSGYFKIIFMNNSPESEGLDKSKVLDYTRDHKWTDLEIEYLQYVIFDMNNHDVKFVDTLLSLYFDGDLGENYAKIERLYQLGNYNAKAALTKLKTLREKDRVNSLKLGIDPLRRLGRDQEAIDVYLNDLKDTRGAITYCLEVRKQDPDEGTNLVYHLLDMYMSKGNWDEVMRILDDSRLNFLDPVVITQRLPDTLPLRVLTPFLDLNLRQLNTNVLDTSMESELLKEKLIDAKNEKLEVQKQYFRLTSRSRCPVCRKPFTAGSILSVTPGDMVMHYGCSMNNSN